MATWIRCSKARALARNMCAAMLLALLLLLGRCDGFAPPGTASLAGSATRTTTTTTCANTRIARKRSPPALRMRNGDGGLDGPADRALACLPYLIPLLDGDRYGMFLFYNFPALGLLDQIALGPFKLVYGSIPFAQLVAFLGLSVLSRNPDLPYSLRFNMQQALLLDIALIFPSLLGGIPAPAVVANGGSNFVFLALVGSVGYALVSNLTGKVPDKIPLISDAARSSIGF